MGKSRLRQEASDAVAEDADVSLDHAVGLEAVLGRAKMDGAARLGRCILQLFHPFGEEVDPAPNASKLLDRVMHAGGILGAGREDVADLHADVQHHQTILVAVDGKA